MSAIGAEDLIFYTDKEGDIYSGGFNVNSIFMKQGTSPIITLNQEKQIGGNHHHQVSDLFDNLVVPNWALSFPFKSGGSINKNLEECEDSEETDVIDDDIHDKLLSVITVHDTEIKNTKNAKIAKKQTRRKKLENIQKKHTRKNVKK